MAFLDEYKQHMLEAIANASSQESQLEQGARILADCEKQGHTIYTFGTGHSHMIGQDVYGRAGGYAKIYPICEIELTLLTHPVKSTHIERTTEYVGVLENLYEVKAGDVVIMISNSGRNALVVEYALRLKEKGAKIIAITSLTHSQSISSRHSSGKRLFEVADVVLNNYAPSGDATTEVRDRIKMGPVSTAVGSYLGHCLFGRMVELLNEEGIKAPVFLSANLDHSDEYNAKLFDKYYFHKGE